MTGIDQKAFYSHWDCKNYWKIDGDMAKWSLWQRNFQNFSNTTYSVQSEYSPLSKYTYFHCLDHWFRYYITPCLRLFCLCYLHRTIRLPNSGYWQYYQRHRQRRCQTYCHSITKGHLLVLWWTEYRFKELISRVRQATKDVVKSEV